MADDLELILDSIEGEGPSPEFVTSLRNRVVAEMAKSETDFDHDPVIEINLRRIARESAMSKNRSMLARGAAAVIAVIAVVTGLLALLGGSNGETETITPPEEVTTTTASSATSTTTEGTTTEESATFDPNTPLLEQESSPLEPGTYRVDSVGTPFTFASDELTIVQLNSAARFVISHTASTGPGDRGIVIMRLSALWDPTQPNMHPDKFAGGWPADDFNGWLDNLADGVTATNREVTTLGGLDAIRVDLETDPATCNPDPEFCAVFGTNHLNNTKVMQPGAKYRVWVVGQGNEDPVAVIVDIPDDSASTWLDTADEILSTLTFGEIAPNPIVSAPAGTAELPLLGGIRIEFVVDTVVVHEYPNFGAIPISGEMADTEFITNPLGLDGNAIETTDDLVARLRVEYTQVNEIESTVVGGVEARVFEISGGPNSYPDVYRDPEDWEGWGPPRLGKMWLIEHPERGLLMINAESFDGVESVFQLAVDQAEQILGTLEFIDLG